MTSKLYNHIKGFYSKHYNLQMRGHIWLFPQAEKEIPAPSALTIVSARNKTPIYLKPVRMRVDGDYIRISDAYNGIMRIHRKLIQRVLLYNYNH